MKLRLFHTVNANDLAYSRFIVVANDLDEGADYIMGVGETSGDAHYAAMTIRKTLNPNRWVNWVIIEYLDKRA